MYEFKLPDIGEGISEAELLEWLVNVGDHIDEGGNICTVSTDKVNVDLTAPCAGRVTGLLWEINTIAQVGDIIMHIDTGNQDSVPEGREVSSDSPNVTERQYSFSETVRTTPAVRRFARENNVDLNAVTPSGPEGQILKKDITDFLNKAKHKDSKQPSGVRREKLSGARLAAAKNIEASSRTLASTTLSFEVCADDLTKSFNTLSSQSQVKLTLFPLIIKCVAIALEEYPSFNATINEDDYELIIHDDIHMGFAVDAGMETGLLVPVIRGVNNISLAGLCESVADTVERTRANQLDTGELRDSTFTLSSTGGLETASMISTTPIINFPNVATLWVSRITERPRAVNGTVQSASMMMCSLSFDHRYLHGADGIAFINFLNEVFNNTGDILKW